ncbi:MAG: TldD/PmbA family protein [Candidatus Muirbacterium halophilum]|nr:TldD/PmbA family protein [Candidatus Muirbacterium halophilum]MCK9477388.1 TldD/PmbA family protein [Candidatus Muirbacterium halophilum]
MSEILREKKIKDIIDIILKTGKEFAPFVFVTVFSIKDALTRFGDNEITQNVYREHVTADIRLSKDKKSTSVSIDRFDVDYLKESFKKAIEILKFQKPDEDYPELPKSIDYIKELPSWCKSTSELTPEKRAEVIKNLAEKCQEKSLISSGIVSNNEGIIAIASSDGLYAFHESSKAKYSATVMDDNGDSGWVEYATNDVDNIDFDKATSLVINKAILNKSPKDMEIGEYTVILEPQAVSDILLFLSYIGFSTMKYYEGDSPFSGKLEQKIFSDKISIIDNAYNQINPGMPFDMEGNKKKQLEIVKDGVFKELPYDIKLSKKYNKVPTGHGFAYPNSNGPLCTNLQILPGKRKMDDIINSSDKCLLVTHFHYTNIINPNDLTFTGMTRDGIFWIENGDISYPVKNFRFTESIIKALNNIVEVSAEQEFASGFFGGGFICPALKIDNFRFSSKTDY